MKSFSIFSFLILSAVLVVGTCKPISAEEIQILGNDSKPPKYYIEDGKAKGILVDIINYVDSKMEHTFKVELLPWQRAYNNALNAEGGIIGLSKTKERLELFDYSDVMYNDTLVLVVIKGQEFIFDSMMNLKGKRLGVQRGSTYGDDFEQMKHLFKIDLDNGADQRLLKLLYNRIDVALIGPGKMGLESVVENNERLKPYRDQFVILKKPFKIDPNYLGFSKSMNMGTFLEEFNKVLHEGYKSGEIQRILQKYSD